jgi:hypothetical protein
MTKDKSIDVILSQSPNGSALYSSDHRIVQFYFSAEYKRLSVKTIAASGLLGTLTIQSRDKPFRIINGDSLIDEVSDWIFFENKNISCWHFDSQEKLLYIKTEYHSSVSIDVDYLGSPYLPFARIMAPFSDFFISDDSKILVEVNHVNFERAELMINNQTVQTWTFPFFEPETWSFNWNTTFFQDGPYVISLISYDRMGSIAEDWINGTVDNTEPTVTIINPTNGAVLNGSIIVNFTSIDENLELTQLFIDESPFDVSGETVLGWNTVDVGDGEHKIRLVAYDKAGNKGENQVTVNTINMKLEIEDIVNRYLTEIKIISNRYLDEIETTRTTYMIVGTIVGLLAGIIGALIANRTQPRKEKNRTTKRKKIDN